MNIKDEFAKLPQLQIYNVKDKKCYYDTLRRQPTYVEITPEEIVRQNTITYLCEKLGVPDIIIYTEDHLRHWGIDDNGRMDIVIAEKTERADQVISLAVVECKAETVALSMQTYEQASYYGKCINAPYIFLCNGIDLLQYKRNECGNYILLDQLVDYDGMTQGQGMPAPEFQTTRCDEAVLNNDLEKVVEYANDMGIIGEDTPDCCIVPIVKMYDALADETHRLPPGSTKLFTLYDDYGFYFRKYGNASGDRAFGSGCYRDLDIDMADGYAKRVFIGILPSGKTVNDPVYGNRRGTTVLTVAINEGKRDQIVLELDLDSYMIIDNHLITITHNGAMHNKGARKEEFMAIVAKHNPNMVRHNKIYLGTFDAEGLLYMDNEDFAQFIMNLITYALLRAEYKRAKRAEAGK